MNPSHHLDIEPDHLIIIKQILHQYLPPEVNVWAFGSHVTGKAKKFSDLDLVLDAHNNSLKREIIINLAEKFDESDLPYKVDLVDWATLDKIKTH